MNSMIGNKLPSIENDITNYSLKGFCQEIFPKLRVRRQSDSYQMVVMAVGEWEATSFKDGRR